MYGKIKTRDVIKFLALSLIDKARDQKEVLA